METYRRKVTAKPMIDDWAESFPPEDFSFMNIQKCKDVIDEDARPWINPAKKDDNGKSKSQSIKLNNNCISDIKDLPEIIESKLSNPNDVLWIDLSFNELAKVDEVLLTFKNLMILNLHGNVVNDIREIEKLGKLKNLRKLTLHGNPIDKEKNYRSYVIQHIPQLKELDFTGLSNGERVTAGVLNHMVFPTMKKTKKPRTED